MIRLDGLVLPLVTRMGTQELRVIEYSVVYSETWNSTDLNEVSNGNVLFT